MRPYLETLPVPPDASWSMLNRRLDDGIPFQWHHHPEHELTLTLNSEGHRFIGDHVDQYGDGDLVLVGPNLPHTWSSRLRHEEDKPHVALVFWFRQSWIDSFIAGAVEFAPIRRLFANAATGLAFPPSFGALVRHQFEAIFDMAPDQRLLSVLQLLLTIAAEQEKAEALTNSVPVLEGENRSRIDRVLLHLHTHYTEPVPMAELADIAAMSESGLHRLFSKHTRSTVSAYLTRLRIGDACARLSGTRQPIAHIASEVGYANLANFNRQFRALRAMTPREYRASFQR